MIDTIVAKCAVAIMFILVAVFVLVVAFSPQPQDVLVKSMAGVQQSRFVIQGEYVIESDHANIRCIVFLDKINNATCYYCGDKLSCVEAK